MKDKKDVVKTEAPTPVEEERISVEDFTTIKDLRTKNAFVAARAEKSILESRISEAEYKNAVLNIYVKYGLTMADSIDEATGKILRNIKKDSK